MSNARYAYANERFLTGQLNWLTQTFRVILVDTRNYAFLKDVHRTLADVPADARVAVSDPLAGTSATSGVARANAVTLSSVSGQTVSAMIVFHDTGTESTSELVVYLDNAHGLPFSPQGASVTITWDAGPSGIFSL